MMDSKTTILAAVLGTVLSGAVFAQDPAAPPAPATPPPAPTANVESLRVFPDAVNLLTSKDRQLVVVQAVYTDGLTRDVSTQATFTFANPALVRKEGTALWAAADGATELKVEFGGKMLTVPVKVEQAAAPRPISFKLDIMPIFMKSGCNTGSCHGAARGKDGFRLSLFGYDPDGDHFRLTREIPGRRLDLAVPEKSLTIEKATGAVPHTGGKRFAPTPNSTRTWLSGSPPAAPATRPRSRPAPASTSIPSRRFSMAKGRRSR
jgi:hypothetical protein